jgi:hypothetical protein
MFFSILFKMKPMVLTKILKLRLNYEHPCLLFNRSDKASDSWGGLPGGRGRRVVSPHRGRSSAPAGER